jgi:hypothetical protein
MPLSDSSDTKLLGACSGEQRNHDVSVQAAALGRREDGLGLGHGQSFGLAAVLALRNRAQGDHVATYMVTSHSPIDRPVQAATTGAASYA